MIEIIYGHKIEGDILTQKKITIGHGFPTHGQMDFITVIEENIDRLTGGTLWATMKWHFWRKRRNK